ncbi:MULTISPECIES: NuoM family protein [unclassified Streptomyces]|uniref:complex I subunit 4 family protein n=1 Tax=unclassified Streptomyces TaxID=2593676 RepID=UPI00088CCFA4|nr:MULTISPECIES: NADH-quinone oxidoreductase subunit M [unclassified Streptomyces]PBC83186.1 NADH dehydrogenase subunit M [Streptomyces sp. 2321.6]SDR44370.1 NADH dehydrogenase subunit M [Streptomyces sp. KS_16]SEC87316.1 NADH dehydrogenase subunit M [Streptomyces sp. 2133.1]SNC69264.1 NADH-quinone oxidoreductase subunit M [Streptomyces sp. 2114.4]
MNPTALQYLLAAVVVLPLLGAAGALLPAPPGLKGRNPGQAVLRHGVTVTGAVLAAAVALAAGFDHDHPARMQATTDLSWIPALDIRIHLGVDGISLPLVVLTALLTFLCALYSYFHMPTGPSPKAFVALLLTLEAGTLASFAVLDLMLFFLAFEMVLIPMYFLIARWGGAGKQAAAWKFILYTLLGSVVMLLGLLLIGVKSGTFDMVALATDNGPKAQLSHTVQLLAVLAVGIGLAVKSPLWPLHSWLPDAHTAAPTVGSVLLAGVLLKMGTYGFVRIALPITPEGMHTFAPYLAALAAIGIIYGSLACLALVRKGAGGDLKRLIAYSSVGHMGFVLLGIASMTPTGVNGALFANIAHGLITGLLFFMVGALKDRTGSTDLDTLSRQSPDHRPSTSGLAAPLPYGTGAALYSKAPRFGGLLAFGAVASLGLPGLAGFWGEMLAMFGAFRPAAGLSRPAFLTFMALAGLGTLLTAAYLLLVVRRVCMGGTPAAVEAVPAVEEGTATAAEAATTAPAAPAPVIPDLARYEYAAWTPLAVLTVLAGLWPAALLGLTDPAVQQLLGGGK